MSTSEINFARGKKIAVGDHTGKQIATYKASLEEKDRVVQSFTSWLKERTANHFGSATPTMTGPMSQLWEAP